MRKLNLTLWALMGLFVFFSCDEDEFGPVVSSDPGAPSITSPQPGESYTLTQQAAQDTLVTIEWTVPDFGFAAAVNYTIEMSLQGDNFASPSEIGKTNKTSLPIIVEPMNNRLLSAGFAGDQQATVEFRVIASVHDSLESQVSEAIPLTFTPYEVEIIFPEIYVPGSYQASSGYGNDWTPEDAPPLASPNSDDKYEGYVYFTNSSTEFKFTDERSWDLNWGDDGADGTLDQNGANIVAADAGYYFINVDLNAMTYTTLNTNWGLIGSATPNGWDSDQDMTYDPTGKVWTITIDLVAGEIKFRANDDWALNYGDTGADGKLDSGGDNIALDEAGNYTIGLNLSEVPYTYTITKN